MNLKDILEKIRSAYGADRDVCFLVEKMEGGDLSARKQLAGRISAKAALLPPLMHHEIGKWGITDEMSQVEAIRKTGGAI